MPVRQPTFPLPVAPQQLRERPSRLFQALAPRVSDGGVVAGDDSLPATPEVGLDGLPHGGADGVRQDHAGASEQSNSAAG